MSVSISKLWFEHHRTAVGISETQPRISWRFAGNANDWQQTAYDLEVKRANRSRVFSVISGDSLYLKWPDTPLEVTERAFVRVRAHGSARQPSTEWSDWAVVETGLLSEEHWAGAMPIGATRESELGSSKRPIYFRKDFQIPHGIQTARLYITALGLYEAKINGSKVGDLVLAPGWQQYTFRHVYDTYDVTEHIKSGANAIGILVGEGWFSGRLTPHIEVREAWGNTVGALALLRITLDDGTTLSVPTDSSWEANAGPLVSSGIYDGETYDSRIENVIRGWSSPGFDSSGWLATRELPMVAGKLSPPDGPPVRKVLEIKPRRIFKSNSGKRLLDFGQNIVGWLKLSNLHGPEGTAIHLRHAEVLENGELALRTLRSAVSVDTLILNGDESQTWEPRFTFHGFRFVQVDGWPEQTPLTKDSFTAMVVYSDMEETGWFKCSNQLLNQFHENVRWSMRGNFISIPTDCPQRDERLGWLGDVHAFGPTSNFLYNTAGFWRGWHKDVWSEMQRDRAMIPPWFVPTVADETNHEPVTFWADAVVANPWNIYRSFGDKTLLREQYSQARAWIDQGLPRNEARLWKRGIFQWGDWLDPDAPPDNPFAGKTPPPFVADAYLIEMTRVLAEMSSVLGEDALVQRYYRERDNLLPEFHREWLNSEGDLSTRSQTSYALAIEFGLFTDATLRARAEKTLRSIIVEDKYHVRTGFAGTPKLGPALERINAVEDFYAMLLQTKPPSWLYQVTLDATTTWERWDSLLEDGSINPGEMTSFNHYAFGSVASWMHKVIGGLWPKEPGWRVVEVKPIPGGAITHADTQYLSPYGEIRVSWTVEGDEFKLEVHIPPNARAEVTLPGEEVTHQIGSGVHLFSCNGYKMPEIGSASIQAK
ncbi:unnamed protein product [Clonostachys chloroleuca]|uniref:alpha-L-rhamnosidase n=1 Tax=Clonostachys chloroleuca TaxID=1926264 RepID=A0AA35M2T2_9HYPO|nr:unnamed protein product [Clonostachys chloroleuca]